MKCCKVSVLNYGAKPGSESLQTKALQDAIDDCFLQGGGVVEVPEGVYLTGGIRLRSNVTLHLLKNAVIKGSRNPEDYFGYLQDQVEPLTDDMITDCLWNRAEVGNNMQRDYSFMRIPGSRWNNALIRAVQAENIAIIGEEGSVLDGSDCYDEQGEERYRGPHCIGLWHCKNIVLKGYCVKDSANWAHSIFHSDNIYAKNLTVLAGHDGIHVTVCRNVSIEDCRFHTGDDCVAGFSNVNVLVKGCELNSACSAFRFGGTNMLVENCHMYGPCKYLFRGSLTVEEKKNGIRPSVEGHRCNMLSAFTYYADYSVPIEYQPGNIIIRNCRIDCADRFLHYNFSGNEMWQSNRPLESITFENIHATGISMPFTAYGDASAPLTLKFHDVNVSLRKGFENIDFMHVCNYEKISVKNVKMENFQGSAFIKIWSEGSIEIENLDCRIPKEKWIAKAQEKFFAEAI